MRLLKQVGPSDEARRPALLLKFENLTDATLECKPIH